MLLAMDAATGKPLWATKTGGSAYRNGMGNGPRGTPTVDGDRVYTLGANGDLICAGVDNGEIVWKKNILKDYNGSNITWGISESVLIDGKQLVCCPGGSVATIAGLDKLTGRGLWRCLMDGAPKASYASPILVEFGGERLIVNYTHTGVVGIRAKNGDPLWGYPVSANGTANCSSPLFDDGMIFTSSGYGTGCAMFQLGPKGNATVGYSNKEMKNHHGGMVVLDGHVYGFDEQVMKCLDLKTGDTVWQNRSVGKGAVTYADGRLYLRSENGPVALCVATTKGYEEKGRFEPKNRSDKPAWSHPVVCGGRLYLRDMDSLAVYNVKE
jgi:outer membrane protein assembly factor BamB